MVEEAASPWHEGPAARLAGLVRQICLARGSDARCFGGMDLRLREADGTLADIMQGDQTVILHPTRTKLPGPSHLIVGEHDLPDVVLEVDNTTDVRRGKLRLYEEWGFPEVWVEVPEMGSPSRPPGRQPGFVIHLLEEGRYRESAESRAFPGWRAEKIHRALNEPVMSEGTAAVLWRVGRALGKGEGTRPDEFLFGKPQAEERAAMACAILCRRGIEAAAHRVRSAVRHASPEAVVEAALTADSETDFVARFG